MRALMVGAGAVGQVYGVHLQRGGATVDVYVRERHAAEARAGFALQPPRASGPRLFRPDAVLCSPDEIAAQTYDQVWLCMSSTGLRGAWLGEVAAALGQATLVSLQPGLRDRELLDPLVPPERLVIGLIAFSAWHGPLPGEPPGPPAMAWWFPPLSPSLFQGARAAGVVADLRRGGCPAAVGDATAGAARGSALLVNLVAAMECAGWTFDGFRSGSWARLAAGAGQEALRASTARLGLSPGPMALALNPTALRLATRLAPWVAPMDFERFLQVHFSKVGDQTMLALDTWIEEGRRQDLPVVQLSALRDALRQARGQQPVGLSAPGP